MTSDRLGDVLTAGHRGPIPPAPSPDRSPCPDPPAENSIMSPHPLERTRNIGIMAHIDAGKTT
ncbi:MAG: hypothetical protein OXG91_05020, partial [bacterium]|nr:hypothetical protein [bacterium]